MKTVQAIVCAATLACAALSFGACAKGAGVIKGIRLPVVGDAEKV